MLFYIAEKLNLLGVIIKDCFSLIKNTNIRKVENTTEKGKAIDASSQIIDGVMKFMMDHMAKIGCPLDPKRHFICRPCKERVGGHFTLEEGVRNPEQRSIPYKCLNLYCQGLRSS